MRNMGIGPTPPYGEGWSLHIDRFAKGHGLNPDIGAVAVGLDRDELEELARITLHALGADEDSAEIWLDTARHQQANRDTGREQRYDG